MERRATEKWYLLMDSGGSLLGRGCLLDSPDAISLQVRVADGKTPEVLAHEDLQLIALSEELPNLLGRVIQRRGDVLVLEKLKSLGAEIRQNLRIPVAFDSFIYPVTGAWQGRRPVRSNDLSCGGIAFFCGEALADGEQVEIVIPVTEEPLILRCEVLRQRVSGGSAPLYAAKFVDLCHDEEHMVRGAVFNIQIENHIQASMLKR